jgi:hypothetical protein
MAVMPDLLAGRIDTFIGAINSLLPLIQEGKLHAIAATSLKRIASLDNACINREPARAQTAWISRTAWSIAAEVGL